MLKEERLNEVLDKLINRAERYEADAVERKDELSIAQYRGEQKVLQEVKSYIAIISQEGN
ncbi:hypothetical protein KC480_05640 [Bacillus velezensis]|uniref:hypothetical protein n=1 Tax=Bacillus velezensis TaxID=492670 RepID=UPI001E2DA391|nr:hypothetical protein [Bacillus velezensis]MCD7911006.1 hypothetical protein [Bacillus velezensis]